MSPAYEAAAVYEAACRAAAGELKDELSKITNNLARIAGLLEDQNGIHTAGYTRPAE